MDNLVVNQYFKINEFYVLWGLGQSIKGETLYESNNFDPFGVQIN